jgi:glutathione S-transferase
MFTVYGDIFSGNCYKVALILRHLSLPFTWKKMSVIDGDTQTKNFRNLNPNGKIPIMVLPDGTILTESNAILNYLAHDSIYLPDERLARARVLEWQFFEQYSHEPTVAVARFIVHFLGAPTNKKELLIEKQAAGYKALDVMERQLKDLPFIAGETYSIADISLYAYTHVCEDGGFCLKAYTHINRWIENVESQKGHRTMSLLAEEIAVRNGK